jgi:tetratricopeptide (TPR) repeat protein
MTGCVVSNISSRTGLRFLLAAAERACGKRQCEQAIRLMEEAIRLSPDEAQMHYQLGFCRSGGCRRHSLIDSDLALRYLQHALSLVEVSGEALLRARILGALGNIQGQRLSDTGGLRQAIACHQEAAEIYSSSGLADDWAREEFNQANLWCDLPEAEVPEKWAEAIEHYENALRVRTRTSDPQHYAATVMNLATALRRLRSGDKTANVLRAIRCYRAALRVYTLETFPRQFAESHNNLGNACLSCPARDKASRMRHARYALRHFERALAVWTAENDPYHHSLVQLNRGGAYLQLSASPRNIEKAVDCLTDAQACALSCGRVDMARMARAQLEKMQGAFC